MSDSFRPGDLIIATEDFPSQMLFSNPPDKDNVFYGCNNWNTPDKVLIVLSTASDKNYMSVLTSTGCVRWARVMRVKHMCMWSKVLKEKSCESVTS